METVIQWGKGTTHTHTHTHTHMHARMCTHLQPGEDEVLAPPQQRVAGEPVLLKPQVRQRVAPVGPAEGVRQLRERRRAGRLDRGIDGRNPSTCLSPFSPFSFIR